MTLLYGTTVTLRPVVEDDIERLTQILNEPEVAQWWPRYDSKRIHQELIEGSHVAAFAVVAEDDVVGCVQYHEETARDYRHATIDVFLDPAWHGKGLGTDAVRTLARHLIYDKGHHRLAIDPAVANEKAIRTYRRVGFQPVGVMREYERNSNGEWQGGLLMDLLKRDLH
ncbi:MAG: GNAT family N-acetyltransferase [Nitriliruptorales bacterium]|nr:GNAT family N-acetyltransferase [Nitriliruptorales bacterium]